MLKQDQNMAFVGQNPPKKYKQVCCEDKWISPLNIIAEFKWNFSFGSRYD